MFTVSFFKRDFTARQTIPGVRFTVERMTHNIFGGCSEATIRVDGDEQTLLYGLLNYLRCPVEIFDESGECVWWGFLHSTVIHPPGVGLTLDGFANRIRVAYTSVALGDVQSDRGTTAWIEDATSQSQYGTREITETLNDITATAATQRANILLAQRKQPLPIVELGSDLAAGRFAILECRGWVDTLDWRTYARALLQQSYTNTDHHDAQKFSGGEFPNPADGVADIAQTLTAIYSMYVESISLIVANGGPNFRCYFYTGTINGFTTLIGKTPDNAYNTAPNPYQWSAFRTVVSDANQTPFYVASGTNFFVTVIANGVWGNPWLVGFNRYPNLGGTFYIRSYLTFSYFALRQSYVPASQDGYGGGGQMIHKLTGTLDGVQLAGDALSSHAEFITAVDAPVSAGLLINAYRDGESPLTRAIEDLLNAGTANNRRLTLHITRARVARIAEEPLGSIASPQLLMTIDGKLYDARKRPIGARSPVGKWVKIIGLPLSDSLSNPPHFFFVERATYTVADDRWDLEPRGSESAFISRVA